MTMFRVGPAGIPATLKTDMNSVLNKKFGTSTDYPPNDWPETVDLMGPLEEKTVSGAIATFADGADAVPLKKCEITLPASLDGYMEIDIKHTGANLLDFTVRDHFGITCEKTADGGAKMSGTAINTSYPVNWIPLTLPAGTYHIYISAVGTGMTIAYFKNGGYGGNLYTGDNVITLNAETEIGGYIRVSNGTVISEPETVYMQLSVAQADFEPYTAPTTHTASLGRTIYGGTADVVNGQGIGEWATVKLKDLTWYYSTSYGGFFHSPSIQSVVSDETYICNSSEYTNVRLNSYQLQNTDDAIGINADNGSAVTGGAPLKSIVVKDTDYTTVADLIAHFTANDSTLCYKLATPETFTFDPVSIDSKSGNNTIWSEQGDTEVTYRSMGTVYQYPEGEGVEF